MIWRSFLSSLFQQALNLTELPAVCNKALNIHEGCEHVAVRVIEGRAADVFQPPPGDVEAELTQIVLEAEIDVIPEINAFAPIFELDRIHWFLPGASPRLYVRLRMILSSSKATVSFLNSMTIWVLVGNVISKESRIRIFAVSA